MFQSKNLYQPKSVTNIAHYGTAILTHMLNRIERSVIKVGYYERSLIVPTGNMTTSDFDLTLGDKRNAINYTKEISNEELDYFKTNKDLVIQDHQQWHIQKNQTNKRSQN